MVRITVLFSSSKFDKELAEFYEEDVSLLALKLLSSAILDSSQNLPTFEVTMSNTIKSTVRSAPVDLATATAASNLFISPFFQVLEVHFTDLVFV